MDNNLIYFILSVIIAVAISIIGYFLNSKSRKKVELTFIEKGSISLFNSLVKELDELEIKYQDKKIEDNLILYNGTLLNSGNMDIDKSMIHSPLKLTLPNNYEWKQVKLIDRSKKLKISHKSETKDLILNWDMMKANEFLEFESIIEFNPVSSKNEDSYPESEIIENLSNNIKIEHRIKDLGLVEKIETPYKPDSIVLSIISNLMTLGLALLCLFGCYDEIVSNRYNVRQEITVDSETFYGSLNRAIDNNHISFKDDSGNIRIVELKNNEIGLTGKISTVKETFSYFTLLLCAFFGIVFLLLGYTKTREDIEDRKYYKKVKKIFNN